MPYSIKDSRARICPGTIQLHLVVNAIDVNHTLAPILSMPNQWARDLVSCRCQPGHLLLIDQFQTTGHNLMSYQCQ